MENYKEYYIEKEKKIKIKPINSVNQNCITIITATTGFEYLTKTWNILRLSLVLLWYKTLNCQKSY